MDAIGLQFKVQEFFLEALAENMFLASISF